MTDCDVKWCSPPSGDKDVEQCNIPLTESLCASGLWVYLRPLPGQQVLCGELVCSPHGLQLPLITLLSLGQLSLVVLHQADLIL